MAAFNALLVEHAAAHPDVVAVDLAGHVVTLTGSDAADPWLLPDGMHFTGDTAEVVAEWLAPALIDSWASG